MSLTLAPRLALLCLLVPCGLAGCGGPSVKKSAASDPNVAVDPQGAQVAPHGSKQFTATVTGTIDTGVVWGVVEATGGTISATGLYTAPANVGMYHVRVSSVAAPGLQGTASVTVTQTPPPPGGGSGGAPGGGGTSYHVGPGQVYAMIGDVPWYKLGPGDTVYIHYKPTPYYEKFLVSGAGTASQWIRVLGVPGPNGERPVISGNNATTGTNMHYHWSDPTLFQFYGVVQIAVGSASNAPIPAYVEIAGLQVQDCDQAYQFSAENGAKTSYDAFCGGIYARGMSHVLIRDNVITHNGLGVYNWTGGDSGLWYDSLQKDITIRNNYFYDNGVSGGYLQHQIYTESLGVVIENNRFGAQRSGAAGNQIKDRSAGTVIRYNWIEEAAGYFIDLVEPEAGWGDLGFSNPRYAQAFVYGNVFVNRGNSNNLVHWNEDHSASHGRALVSSATTAGGPGSGKLFFYSNTILTLSNPQYWPNFFFNVTSGGYECDTGATFPGRIDARNNIFAVLPASGAAANALQFGYCGLENFDFGANWVSPNQAPSWWQKSGSATVTGTNNFVSPSNNNPGFVSVTGSDLHLAAGSSALGAGGALAPEVTNNLLGLDLSPNQQFVEYNQPLAPRTLTGKGSDLGALGR